MRDDHHIKSKFGKQILRERENRQRCAGNDNPIRSNRGTLMAPLMDDSIVGPQGTLLVPGPSFVQRLCGPSMLNFFTLSDSPLRAE